MSNDKTAYTSMSMCAHANEVPRGGVCYCPFFCGCREHMCPPMIDPGVSGETRVVDPISGGEKGAKLARFSLIPPDWLWALAEHYGVGAKKYADRNWERGYKWSLSIDAMERHYTAWKDGEDIDAETGTHHLISAAWHLIALWWFQKHRKGTDDVRRML